MCLKLIKESSRSKNHDTKVRAAEAVGIILIREAGAIGEGSGPLPSLSTLLPCVGKLLDLSNNSEVLVTCMESVARVAEKDCQLLAPILADLLVLLANLLEHTSGPTKISAEDLVGSCLGIVEGPERAFETLKSLPRVEAVVNQQVTLSVLKRVSGRMLK